MVCLTAAVEVIREDALNWGVRYSCDPTDSVRACDWGNGRVFGLGNSKAARVYWSASFCSTYEGACMPTADPSSTSVSGL
jgi:hypothetical protein